MRQGGQARRQRDGHRQRHPEPEPTPHRPVAAILNDLPSAAYISRTAGDGSIFEVVPGEPIDGGPYGIGFAKDDVALRDSVNKALGELIADGTYLKILQSWGGVEQGALKESAINGA